MKTNITIMAIFIFSTILISCGDNSSDAEDFTQISQLACERAQECLSADDFQEEYTSFDECLDIFEDVLRAKHQELEKNDATSCFDYLIEYYQCTLKLSCDDIKNSNYQLCSTVQTQYDDCVSSAVSTSK